MTCYLACQNIDNSAKSRYGISLADQEGFSLGSHIAPAVHRPDKETTPRCGLEKRELYEYQDRDRIWRPVASLWHWHNHVSELELVSRVFSHG
jgi:hypothetical protein